MKVVGKILKWSLIAATIVVIVGLGYFFYSLPSPKQVGRALKSVSQAEKSDLLPSHVPPSVQAQGQVAQTQEVLQPQTETPEEIAKREERARSNAIAKSLLEREPQDIAVCDNLSNAPTSKVTQSGQMEQALETIFDDSDTDPYVQAFRIPLAHIFHRPLLKNLLEEIQTFENKPEEGVLDKIGFYGRVAAMGADLIANKSYFEHLTDHAYNLFVISQVVGRRPELARDPKLLDFCLQIEAEVKSGELTNLDEERKEVLALLDYAGITPAELQFEPEKRMKLDVKSDRHGFSLGLGNQ